MNREAYRVMAFNNHCMLGNPCERILINYVRETIEDGAFVCCPLQLKELGEVTKH